MKSNKILYLILFSFFCSLGFSQKGKIKQATKAYNDYSYLKTSKILLEVAESGYKSVELFEKLGNSYYFNNKMEDAAKWYGELMALEESVDSEYYFRYAQALKSIENYSESDKWMEKFYESNKSDLRGKAFANKVDYLSSIDELSKDLEVYNLDINSSFSDMGTMLYKDKIIFASSRGGGKNYEWNNQPYLDLYSAEKQSTTGRYGNVKAFGEPNVNTKYHESTVSFSPHENLMYFTRNNYNKGKFKKDSEGTNRLKIYRGTFNGREWDDIESVHFNSNEYSVAHPAVNAKGTKLYFASDMPGSKGLSDLYVVDIYKDGTLGTPKNLGTSVNTEAQETFPFINTVGDLYFSSNGFVGLGGLDVFVIRDFENKYENHEQLVIENVGKPINSSKDDFGYYENLITKEGFFTSNREGGKGDDDIYSFTIQECVQLVEGVVKDKNTLELLPNSMVTLYDGKGEKLNEQLVGLDAAYKFELECEAEYIVRGEKENYRGDEKRITTPKKKQALKLDLLLEEEAKVIEVGTDLAKVLEIPMIHFDFDKSNIRPDAEIELQKIIAVLKEYPTMTIDVRSHTDSRGSDTYNYALSNRRNKSTIKYIVEVGNIDASRLTGRGYGEQEHVNNCSNGVKCSEEEHQLNRRSEFIVLSM